MANEEVEELEPIKTGAKTKADKAKDVTRRRAIASPPADDENSGNSSKEPKSDETAKTKS